MAKPKHKPSQISQGGIGSKIVEGIKRLREWLLRQWNKVPPVKWFLDSFEWLVAKAIGSIVYGATFVGVIYVGLLFKESFLGEVVAPLFYDVGVAYTQALLNLGVTYVGFPAAWLALAPTIMVGVPAAILGYHALAALISGTLWENSSVGFGHFILGKALPASTVILPFVGFYAFMSLGWGLSASLWWTAVSSTAAAFLYEIGSATLTFAKKKLEEKAKQSALPTKVTAPQTNKRGKPTGPRPDGLLHQFNRQKKEDAAPPTQKRAPVAKNTSPARNAKPRRLQ